MMNLRVFSACATIASLMFVAACGGGGGGDGPQPPPPPQPQTIAFAQGGPLNVLLNSVTSNTASGGAGTGAIAYASSNTSAVTVDATSGAATAIGVGSATITATKAASSAHNQAQATYSINVQTADRVSAWIGAGGSEVHMPASANGKSFGRARVADCMPQDTVVTCAGALVTPVNGQPINDTSATLSTPAYYTIVDGSTIGTPVVVNSSRFSERIGHGAVFFNGRYWVIGGGQPAIPGAGPPAAHALQSDVWSSVDGRSWKLENGSAAFGGMWLHQTLVHDGWIWIIGGVRANNTGTNEVWRSSNGIDWQQVSAILPSTSPVFLAATAFNDELWIVRNGISYSSSNGVDWTQRSIPVSAIDGGTPREYATLTAYNGFLWYIAGARNTGQRNAVSDVWRSPDGITWVQVNPNAFAPRNQHSAFVLNNRLWVFGGRGVANNVDGATTADAFSTADGMTWQAESTTSEIDRSFFTEVIQEPGRITIVGGIQRAYSNRLWQTTNGNDWTELAPVDHSPRLLGSAVSFNGFMWLIGGGRLDGLDTDEVWRSADGLHWTRVLPNGPLFSPRDSHGTVVFNNRLWVIGGWDFFTAEGGSETFVNDVWSSADGATWTQHTATAPFSARAAHEVVVFNGRIWVIGGSNGSTRLNDIWSSADGASWMPEAANPAFTPRYGHRVIAYDNALWLFGGSDSPTGVVSTGLDDVWRSTNGRDWSQLASGTHFSPRTEHAVAVMNNRIYLVAGFSNNDYYAGVRFNDVWSTTNGVNWTQETPAAPFAGRNGGRLVTHNGELYLIGGFGIERQHNIWRSNDGVSWRLGFSHPMVAP